MILALHHIQISMPAGGEAQARAFYTDVLGLAEVAKPQALQGRGGAWFETNAIRVHLGVDPNFSPATKAHPAFEVQRLQDTIDHLDRLDVSYKRDVDLPGIRRIFVDDPFGNRIELLETAQI